MRYAVQKGKLLDDYLKFRDDTKLLELGDTIALLDARINELLGRLDDHDSSQIWQELSEAHKQIQQAWDSLEAQVREFDRAQKSKNSDKAKEALDKLFGLIGTGMPDELSSTIEQGRKDYDTWTDIFRTIEQRRKTTDTDIRRRQALHQMVSIERVLKLQEEQFAVIARHISDENIRKAIAYELLETIASIGKGVETAGGDNLLIR